MLKSSAVDNYVELITPNLWYRLIHIVDNVGAFVRGGVNDSKFFDAKELFHEAVGEIAPLILGERCGWPSELC